MGWKNVQYKDGKMKTSESGGGGSSTFAGLDDVSFNNIQNGQVPKYNSATQKWENANESGGGTVTDVTVDGVSVVNQQGVAEIPAIPEDISDLSNVQFSNLTDNQPLRYNATSQKWVNGADNYPPLIYSDEEREIGVWRDGKPLYEKTWEFDSAITIASNSWTDVPISNSTIEGIIGVKGYNLYSGKISCWNGFSATADSGTYVKILQNRNASAVVKYLTLQYTKTTDTAGSGTWTTQGGYAHHYSTEEKVIGTWIDGKPLYERVFDLGSDVAVDYSAFTNTSINASQMKAIIDAWGIYSTGATKYSLMANISNNIIRLQTDRNGAAASVRYVILQYTKTTDV